MQRFNGSLKNIIQTVTNEDLTDDVKFNLTQKLNNIVSRIGGVKAPESSDDQAIENGKELDKIAEFIKSHEIKLPEINPELNLNTGVDLFLVEYVRMMDQVNALEAELAGLDVT